MRITVTTTTTTTLMREKGADEDPNLRIGAEDSVQRFAGASDEWGSKPSRPMTGTTVRRREVVECVDPLMIRVGELPEEQTSSLKGQIKGRVLCRPYSATQRTCVPEAFYGLEGQRIGPDNDKPAGGQDARWLVATPSAQQCDAVAKEMDAIEGPHVVRKQFRGIFDRLGAPELETRGTTLDGIRQHPKPPGGAAAPRPGTARDVLKPERKTTKTASRPQSSPEKKSSSSNFFMLAKPAVQQKQQPANAEAPPRLFAETKNGLPPAVTAQYADDYKLVCPACRRDRSHRCSYCLLARTSPEPRLKLADVGARLLRHRKMGAEDLLDALERYGRCTDFARDVHASLRVVAGAAKVKAGGMMCNMHAAEHEDLEARAERLEAELEAARSALDDAREREARLERRLEVSKMAEDDYEERIAALTRMLAQAEVVERQLRETTVMMHEEALAVKEDLDALRRKLATIEPDHKTNQRHNRALREALEDVEACLRHLPKLRRRVNDYEARELARMTNRADAHAQTTTTIAAAPIVEAPAPARADVPAEAVAPAPPPRFFDLGHVQDAALGAVMDTAHSIIQAKALADVADADHPARLPDLIRRVHPEEHKAHAFAGSVRTHLASAHTPLRLYAFAAAAGFVCDDVWAPSIADLVVGLLASVHPDRASLGRWLSEDYDRRVMVPKDTIVSALRNAVYAPGAVIAALCGPAEIQSLSSRLYADSEDDDAVQLDRVLAMVLDTYIERCRWTIDDMTSHFNEWRCQPCTFASFVEATATYSPCPVGSLTLGEAHFNDNIAAAFSSSSSSSRRRDCQHAVWARLAAAAAPNTSSVIHQRKGSKVVRRKSVSKPQTAAAAAAAAAFDGRPTALSVTPAQLARACHERGFYPPPPPPS